MTNPDIRDFGQNVGTKNHDDTPALQAAADSGSTVEIAAPVTIEGTVTVDRRPTLFRGPAWGSLREQRGALIVWEGQAGVPMLRFHGCLGGGVDCVRLVGNPEARPSCAVSIHQGGDNGISGNMTFDRLWIGNKNGFDDRDGMQFVNGIVFDGDDANHDNVTFGTTVIRGCERYGVDIPGVQYIAPSFWNLSIANCGTGMRAASQVTVDTAEFSACGVDFAPIGAGVPGFLVTNFNSEWSGRLADFSGCMYTGILAICGGYWQLGKNTSTAIIRGAAAGLVRIHLQHFTFTLPGMAANPPVFDLTHGGGLSRECILEDVTGIDASWFRLSSIDSGAARGLVRCASREQEWEYRLGVGQGYQGQSGTQPPLIPQASQPYQIPYAPRLTLYPCLGSYQRVTLSGDAYLDAAFPGGVGLGGQRLTLEALNPGPSAQHLAFGPKIRTQGGPVILSPGRRILMGLLSDGTAWTEASRSGPL